MKPAPVSLLPPSLSKPKVFVTDTILSVENSSNYGVTKCNSISNIRRCSSSMISTPVTPKPSPTQAPIAVNSISEARLERNVRKATYTELQCCPPPTDTVRELQQSLKECKDYAKALELQLSREKAVQEVLQMDLKIINDKYTSVIGKMDDICQEKKNLELELEDLTVTLFEQANEMVAQQKKISQALEKDNLRLSKELSETLQRLADESMQLRELRDKLCKQDEVHKVSFMSSRSDSAAISNSSLKKMINEMEQSPSRVGLPIPLQKTHIVVNSSPYKEFVDFLTVSKATSAKSQYSVAYIKRTQIEDVEPCLWFGDRAPVGSKKIIQAILKQACFIEEHVSSAVERPAGGTWLTSRKWQTAGACHLCYFGNVTFRFRLGDKCDWIYIDHACRQKLVAVCEFYAFIQNIFDGLYHSQSNMDLYNQSLRLKAKMFQARVAMYSIAKS